MEFDPRMRIEPKRSCDSRRGNARRKVAESLWLSRTFFVTATKRRVVFIIYYSQPLMTQTASIKYDFISFSLFCM